MDEKLFEYSYIRQREESRFLEAPKRSRKLHYVLLGR
jgi:hypothetical protein